MIQGQACCQRPIRVKTEEDIHVVERCWKFVLNLTKSFSSWGDLPLVFGRKLIRNRFRKASNSTVKYLDSKGRERFKGSASLKKTQRYPMRFGRAVF